MLEILQERGLVHEKAYLAHLRGKGLTVVELPDAGVTEAAFEQTVGAMREGAEAIYQATLIDGRWHGRADVLLRCERPSALGPWSYEVVDTKVARETRGGTVLQLCLYSSIVGTIQDRLPEHMYVVPPGAYADPERYRLDDYLAYYRLVRTRLEQATAVPLGDELPTYPDPVPQCDICRWWPECVKRRRADDHLCLVAGLAPLHQRELAACGIDTLEKLARAELPLDPRPARGSDEVYARAHHQARLQLAARERGQPGYETLPVEPDRGLARLPAPSVGDVFLDLEGDHFVADGGREYLFGWAELGADGRPAYRRIWALDPEGERRGFEALIDALMARWEQHPDMHVYHFAPYEPTALKRLMGRYATREDEVDRLLRGRRLVDLYAVVRQGLRAGIESYSIKDLEALYGFEREIDLRDATLHLRAVERALELGDADALPAETRAAVEAYNRDDCVSTLHLRDWLERVRTEVVEQGTEVPRPENPPAEPSQELDERTRRLQALFETLTRDVPADPDERSPEQQARLLLGHMLEWHRREEKATWWEYFRLRDLSEEDLLDEKPGLSALVLVGRVGGTDRCPVHRYRFPSQDHDVRAGQTAYAVGGEEIGDVDDVNPGARTIDLKKREKAKDLHPSAIFGHLYISPEPKPEALERLATWVAEHGIDADGQHRAARDLLLRHSPRLLPGAGPSLRREGEELGIAARRLALELDRSVLPVQGPPGAGKTHMGARMICELVRAGKKVGVTAVSHKVIDNLLKEVLSAAREERTEVRCIHKGTDSEPGVDDAKSNDALLDAISSGEGQVGAGTAWAWARPEFAGSVDVLVVDEAGQMSLADTLAAAQAASSLVLLGDPQQLQQPLQGSHPDGTDTSALEHLLAGGETLPDDRGLFLAETWRLHPTICRFTSEQFYEGRLESRTDQGLELQRLVGPTPFAGSGLWLFPVNHEANQSASPEEVEAVAEIVSTLLRSGVGWIDRHGETRPLKPKHILVVAPYNAQVAALSERLPELRIGTVDKFQGQEAPVVIYSMTTSSRDDAPRGMEFLYDRHRLNVATSRARCACILVGSPRLLEPECRTPHQMRLANALCRYTDLAAREGAS